MRKTLILIIIALLTIQLVSAAVTNMDIECNNCANYRFNLDGPNPIVSESTSLPIPSAADGSLGYFVGRIFCTDTGNVIISADGDYIATIRFSKLATTSAAGISGTSAGYIQLREQNNHAGEWSVVLASDPIFFYFHPLIDAVSQNKYEFLYANPIPGYAKIDANNLGIQLGTCDERRIYAAGVYAYTEVENAGYPGITDLHKVYARSDISLTGLYTEGIRVAEVGCGVSDENTLSASQICGKKGCNAILSASYIELNIPENALEEEVSFINGFSGEIITIYKFENTEQPGLVSPLYYITPEDLTLNLPAALTLEYEENLINNENDVSLARLDGRNLIKLETEFIDKEKNRITAETDNLGYFVAAEDKTPPKIEISASPEELWPPNNKPVDVAIYGSVIDDVSGVNKNSLKLTINNEEKEFSIDDFGNFNFIAPLIAKRSGQEKQGYEYKIELSAEDNFGNAAASSSIVLVPHDQRK